MLEVNGNIWDYTGPNDIICVTTNGIVNKVGRLVMGKGIALEACYKRPDLPQKLGNLVKAFGNCPNLLLEEKIMSFPTKNHWIDNSDLSLIKRSAQIAQIIAEDNKELKFYLPRPGCGNGNLKWEDVKPVIAEILSDSFTIVNQEK